MTPSEHADAVAIGEVVTLSYTEVEVHGPCRLPHRTNVRDCRRAVYLALLARGIKPWALNRPAFGYDDAAGHVIVWEQVPVVRTVEPEAPYP